MAETSAEISQIGITRYHILPKPLKIISIALIVIGLGSFVLYTFSWSIRGWVMDSNLYYYILYLCFSTCVFLYMPMRKKDRNRIPWYDLVLAVFVFGIATYFAANYWEITFIGWAPPPSIVQTILAGIMATIAIETGRRMAGWPLVVLAVVLGGYPLIADHMPGILWGFGISFTDLLNEFAFGKNGMLGLPAQVTGDILIGFLIFAGMMIGTGAGNFFLKLCLALLGRFRGGPAKVAVLASGFFGSLSGTPISNIVATGSVTIPTMKRLGYPSHYAGAIEAVASTGGMIMPPVMGSIAFIMAILTDIPYGTIVIGAAIPALLYYLGLLVQVDSYAARVGLRGLPREELPSLWRTLKEGWPYLLVLIFLTVGLIYFRWGVRAAVYAAGLMFLLSFFNKTYRMSAKKLIETLATVGSLIVFTMSIMLPIGFIVIGIMVPGTLTAITVELITIGEISPVIILLMATAICYFFGMIGIAIIPYIVLAVIALPAVVSATGLSLMGLHLFLIYYVIMAPITPPVAISSFVGAAVASAPPMKTAWTSMRLAVVLYFIPFFFVFNPSLILQGSLLKTAYLLPLCIIGIAILASGLEGYLVRIGNLPLWSRPLLFAAGFMIAFPGTTSTMGWITTVIGAVIVAATIAILIIIKRTAAPKVSYA